MMKTVMRIAGTFTVACLALLAVVAMVTVPADLTTPAPVYGGGLRS